MPKHVYVRGQDGVLRQLADTEDELQRLLAEHAEVLAGDQMRPDAPLRWLLVKREQHVGDGESSAR